MYHMVLLVVPRIAHTGATRDFGLSGHYVDEYGGSHSLVLGRNLQHLSYIFS